MADKIMHVDYFIQQLVKAKTLPSVYATGCFGWPLNYGDNMERIIDEWPNNQKPAHEKVIRDRAAEAKAAGTECYGWDCINLVKGILWDWQGDPKQEYGGAKYLSDNVPDTTVNDFWSDCCYDQRTDWNAIVPGEFLYYGNGSHCGIYIGDGLAIEATGKWDRKCTLSVVENLIDKFPENNNKPQHRTWQGHAKIIYIDYPEDNMNKIICPCCGAELNVQVTLSPVEDLLDIYTVKDGDSPWSISEKYYGTGTKYYIIMDYNNLPRDAYIYTGQQLKIPRI